MRQRVVAALAAAAALLAVGGLATLVFWSDGMPQDTLRKPAPAGTVPIAVLGDSLSHAYQDRIFFPPGTRERGGDYHAGTLQWTEALNRLRGHEIDMGPWVAWGRPGVVARARELLGLPAGRAPKKEDYLYNFANSGAACKNLNGGRFRQTPRLLALMKQAPARWQHGVVVIRIGLNDWTWLLDLQSREPDAPQLRAAAAFCIDQTRLAMNAILAEYPAMRIVLVGYVNEADDPIHFDKWRTAAATANIGRALAMFNARLSELAASTPQASFFDDFAWFDQRWGSRGPNGEPDYKTVTIGSLAVRNTKGDAPRNALLDDLHPGLVWNVLWAQAMARHLQGLGLAVTPISDPEVADLVASQIAQVKVPGS